MTTYCHPHALVSPEAKLDEGVRVWAFTQVREGVVIGAHSNVGSHCYIDFDVVIGANCKLQSGALLFHGTVLDEGVFVGPGAVVTNDLRPRAINPDGSLKGPEDWRVDGVHVSKGASLGAGSIVIAGVSVGEFAIVAAGAIVTRDVPAHALAVGAPARVNGWVCCCGAPLSVEDDQGVCGECSRVHRVLSP